MTEGQEENLQASSEDGSVAEHVEFVDWPSSISLIVYYPFMTRALASVLTFVQLLQLFNHLKVIPADFAAEKRSLTLICSILQ